MDDFLAGGIVTASFLAGLFFLRFWRETHDRFFLLFALSFWIEGANRFALTRFAAPSEDAPLFYLVRLLAYGLIIVAIVMKNRGIR